MAKVQTSGRGTMKKLFQKKLTPAELAPALEKVYGIFKEQGSSPKAHENAKRTLRNKWLLTEGPIRKQTETAKQQARLLGIEYVEVSALTGHKVVEVFHKIALTLLSHKHPGHAR